MTQRFQRFTKRYVSVLVVLIGLAVVGSILFYSGCGMTSSPNIPANPTPTPTPTPDTPPTSTITSPTEGAIVLIGKPVAITGTASDPDGSVVKVEVSVDGGATFSAATGTTAWSFNWLPLTLGPVTIKSRAVDNAGSVQNPPAQIHVTVDAPPTSTITSPAEGATVPIGKPVTITGTASNAGGRSVVRVEVSVDGGATFSAATGTTAWSFNWTPTTPGPATIKSRAVDNTGSVQNPPAEIHVKVEAIILVGTAVNITGTASDPDGGSVVRLNVSVYSGTTFSVATGTTAWSFNWTPTTPGRVTIISQAVDDGGNAQNPLTEITVTVPIRVPSDQPTIQSAINVALNGDTVLVAPGTYSENIDFKGKAITVTSESGPKDTIIVGGNVAPVVRFTSREGRDSVLNGFTLQNGREVLGRPEEGGGISIFGTSPTITNNVIRNNLACSGGGIWIAFGSPLIQLNTITGNSNNLCVGGNGGSGIYISGDSPEILDNVISDNAGPVAFGGGIYLAGTGTPIVKNNIIKGNNATNQGGGIYIPNISNALIVQNLITGNQAPNGGGLYWLVPAGGRRPILVNNTIADNNATSIGSGIFAAALDAQTELTNKIKVEKPGQFGLYCGSFDDQNPPIIRFNNIFSANGMAYGGSCRDMTGTNDNISADPLFTNPTQGDYHLQKGSPSIDAGDNLAPNLPDKDLDGHPRILDGSGKGTAIVDMGVYEFLPLPSAVWNFIPRRPRSFTAKIPIGAGSPNTLSSISWAKPFNLGGRRIVKGNSLWASYRR